ncbi:MAG TPA: MOSC N-terminal beta barrel domain-containing protein [Acidimicrobiales bacterium]|jgi:hypothetical protein
MEMAMTADARVGTVQALWRYPVKSLQGTAVERVEVRANGVEGDRQWGIVDVATGKVLSAKRWPALLEAFAAPAGKTDVTVALPDGSTWDSSDREIDAALSAWLDHEVRLSRPSLEAGTAYELTMDPTDDSSEPWDFATPAGSFADLASVHVLTTASLGAIRAEHPDGDWAVERFRPTALIDTGTATGYLEDGWVGDQIGIGDAVIDVFMATPRCAMPGRAQPPQHLPADKSILTTIRDHHDNNLGVYASVITPGPVAVGDQVRPT